MRQDGKGIVTEGMACGIEDFMRVIQYGNHGQYKSDHKDCVESAGKKIYNILL